MSKKTQASSEALGKSHANEAGIFVRQLRENDLPAADTILRTAFNTFTGVPNLFGTRDYVRTRWRAHPEAAIAAEIDGTLVGSNFVTHWGTMAFFGPLSVRTDLWDQGIGKAMMEATLDLLEALGTRRQGLFTFSHSPKHIGLYEKYGFWPRFLTPILSKAIGPRDGDTQGTAYSQLADAQRKSYEGTARELTDTLCDGLDVGREIRSVQAQGIGDTIFLAQGNRLEGFAICHVGAGSEAGEETCYLKFALVRSGPRAELEFDRLLGACANLALARGAQRIELGVSTACRALCEALHSRGYRAGLIGVTMERPNGTAYHRPDAWVVSDWR